MCLSVDGIHAHAAGCACDINAARQVQRQRVGHPRDRPPRWALMVTPRHDVFLIILLSSLMRKQVDGCCSSMLGIWGLGDAEMRHLALA